MKFIYYKNSNGYNDEGSIKITRSEAEDLVGVPNMSSLHDGTIFNVTGISVWAEEA